MAIVYRALCWLILLGHVVIADPSAADRATFDAACAQKMGSGFIARFDASDQPIDCVTPPSKPCFFGRYTDIATGQPGCCGAPGLKYMSDKASKTGACCSPGQNYQYSAASGTGSCVNPPPPIPPDPPLSCPGSNGRYKTVNGVTFQIWCQRAVWRMIPLFMLPWYRSQVASMPLLPGVTNADACLQNCAYDPKCQGANWMENKSCGKNVYGSGLYGNLYQNPPNTDTWGYQCMAFVSVPKRPGT